MTGDRFRKRFPLIVPSWIYTQLQRNQQPLSTLLNLNKLSQACSAEDVALFYVLNTDVEYLNKVFGPGDNLVGCLHDYWARQFGAQLERVLELRALYRDALNERLFYEDASVSDNPLLVHTESEDLQVSAIIIIIKPGQLGGDSNRVAQQYLVREYMRQCYAFTEYANLAKDPLFERYFASVALNNVSETA